MLKIKYDIDVYKRQVLSIHWFIKEINTNNLHNIKTIVFNHYRYLCYFLIKNHVIPYPLNLLFLFDNNALYL